MTFDTVPRTDGPGPPPERWWWAGETDSPPPPPQGAPGSPAPQRPRRLSALLAVGALAAGALGGVGTAAVLSAAPGTVLPRVSSAPAGALDARAVAAAVLPSVVSIQTESFAGSGAGSGFVLDEQGHVLTNAHVVAGAQRVLVVTDDGKRLAAEVVGRDPASDVAVVRVPDGSGLPPATLGSSRDVQVGDEVLAVGSPLGLAGTVTQGIVSTTNREVRLGDGERVRALQTDASINPGNSGGPLVDAAGRVIGVNTAIATLGGQGSGSIGIGFAIPVDRAADVAERLIGG
jgi:putative serine protease PepD